MSEEESTQSEATSRKPVKLTQKLVAGLKAPASGRMWFVDSALPGFGVLVFPSGKKSFVVRYGTRQSRRLLTVGPYGPLTVEMARERARVILGRVAQGEDPALDKKAARTIPTFREWTERYLEEIEGRLSPAWKRETARYLREAGRQLDPLPLTAIAPTDVERFFQAKREKGNATANRALAALRACLGSAWRHGLLPENPAVKVRALRENPPRDRVLSDEEMANLFKALDACEDPSIRAGFRLLVECGVRQSELKRAKWEDFNLEGHSWRIPRAKSGRSEEVVLTDEAVTILKEIPRTTSPHLFPGRDPSRHRGSLYAAWKRIRDAAGLGDVTPHDLRRSYCRMATDVAGIEVASRLLRHSDIRVTQKVYNPMRLETLRKAAERATQERKRRVLKVLEGGQADG